MYEKDVESKSSTWIIIYFWKKSANGGCNEIWRNAAEIDRHCIKKDEFCQLSIEQNADRKHFVILSYTITSLRRLQTDFKIFRAIVNILEFTKFALNFYFYCLINPNIRNICTSVVMCRKIARQPRVKGQPQTPISLYTR